MTLAAERPQLPFARPNLLELAPFYEVLRREAPIAPVTTPAGDPAWLVTRFAEVRDLLGDKRFGRSHPIPSGRPGSAPPPYRTVRPVTTSPRRPTTRGCAGR
jgi:cytochrome P450